MNVSEYQQEELPAKHGLASILMRREPVFPGSVASDEPCMRRVDLQFEDITYPFWIGCRCTGEIAEHIAELSASSLHIVTDHTVSALHVKPLVESLRDVAPIFVWSVEEGEMRKSLQTLDQLANQLLNAGADRNSVVVAVGGGVIGNVAGLLAGLLFRGIRLVHIPTTLMAMSDSTISLKQAVNMPQGKNLIGCFHTPAAVFADTAYLSTLPLVQLRSGLCEIIKNVLTIDADHLPLVSTTLNPEACYDEMMLKRFVEAGVAAKQRVMIGDKREKNAAVVFEYGHTVGHAIELTCGGILSHGEAVGLGMIVAAEVACELGVLPTDVRDLHYRLLRRNGVSLHAPRGLTPEVVMTALSFDNKRGYVQAANEKIPMILLRGLGEPMWGKGAQPLTLVGTGLIDAVLRRHIFHSDPSYSF